MTYNQIVAKAMDRLNLTSPDAANRIGEYVNDRYRWVTSSIGLESSRIAQTDVVVDPSDTITYPDLPDITIDDYEKILRVIYLNGTQIRTLTEQTYDEITSSTLNTETPRSFAVKTIGASSVVITLDSYTPLASFTLRIEGYVPSSTLSGTNEPAFPEDFHDILVYGAMADELRKMEKPQLAQEREMKFELRLSDLRMFIAKSGYLDIVQGKNKPSQTWYRPWYSRISG